MTEDDFNSQNQPSAQGESSAQQPAGHQSPVQPTQQTAQETAQPASYPVPEVQPQAQHQVQPAQQVQPQAQHQVQPTQHQTHQPQHAPSHAANQAQNAPANNPHAAQGHAMHNHVEKNKSKAGSFLFGIIGVIVGAVIVFGTLFFSGFISAPTIGSSAPIEIAATANDAEQSLAEQVAAKCLPSVVSIMVYTQGSPADSIYGNLLGGGDSDSSEQASGMGSGVVVDDSGHILTNAHVVQGGTKFVVTFNDKSTAQATLVGADISTDLAVLQVNKSGLQPLEIADSDSVNVGEWVMAIGSPFGHEQSISTGIVSAKYRSQAVESAGGVTFYTNMIQTDAAINPGNSGGALVNERGQLIGINSIINSTSGASAGIGFAIPADRAAEVANQLISDGVVSHAFIGVNLATVNAATAPELNTSAQSGAYVETVVEGSPADAAGLRAGDVIQAYNGVTVTTASELIIEVRGSSPGDEVTLSILRGSEKMDITVTLGSDT